MIYIINTDNNCPEIGNDDDSGDSDEHIINDDHKNDNDVDEEAYQEVVESLESERARTFLTRPALTSGQVTSCTSNTCLPSLPRKAFFRSPGCRL